MISHNHPPTTQPGNSVMRRHGLCALIRSILAAANILVSLVVREAKLDRPIDHRWCFGVLLSCLGFRRRACLWYSTKTRCWQQPVNTAMQSSVLRPLTCRSSA